MGNRLAYEGIKEEMSFGLYIGNKLLTLAAALMYFKNPKDLCTGYWAFSKEFLKSVDIKAKGFDLEANLFTEAVKKGFKIKSIPIKYNTRIGEKKLRHYHGIQIFFRLVKERFN